MKKKFKIILICFLSIIILGIFTSLGINAYIKSSTKSQIIEIGEEINIDAILVLGAGVWGDKPGAVLKDRLDVAYEAFLEYNVPVILSGDHGKEYYDEVNVMKNYMLEKEVPKELIFMDHAGFSTYESVYRARDIFEASNILIITQKYHLYRALYISNRLGLNSYGISSTKRVYGNEDSQQIREYLARNKDFVKSVFKPEPTYLGDSIPVSGSGNVTSD